MDRRPTRRACLSAAALLSANAPAPAHAASGLALAARTHFYARPQHRQALTDCLVQVLGCPPPVEMSVPDLGPILAFRFPGGGSASVEFTDEALDESQARRGAWLELNTPDPQAAQQAVLAAGLRQVRYPATKTFYFAAPGGQVFSIAAPGRGG